MARRARRRSARRPSWARALPPPEIPRGYVRLFPRMDPSKAARVALFVQEQATWSYNLVEVALQEICPQVGIVIKDSMSTPYRYLRAGRWLLRKDPQLTKKLAAVWG